MVDYDTAVTVVQDPNADPVMLAKIAYENPEFGANVAANPRAYPGLKRWLAEFGDQRAREFLSGMGVTAQGEPVQPREAEPAAQADAPAFGQAPAGAPAGFGTATAGAPAGAPAGGMTDAPADFGNGGERLSDSLVNELADVADPAPAAYDQPAFQMPVATNPYGFTAELAMTTTDQMQIAQIAQYAPELRPCIAYNPNTYQALLDWLAQLHDPQIDAALAARR